jgi:hypothetical protein
MGTRADFYVGRGESAEWLGSIAWDGYPCGVALTGKSVFTAAGEADYRKAVAEFLASEDSATLPEMGWPWPWNDSGTTDYAYAFEDGKTLGSNFGQPWFVVDADEGAVDYGEPDEDEQSGPQAVFPDMAARKNTTYGKRSGVLIVSPKSGGQS